MLIEEIYEMWELLPALYLAALQEGEWKDELTWYSFPSKGQPAQLAEMIPREATFWRRSRECTSGKTARRMPKLWLSANNTPSYAGYEKGGDFFHFATSWLQGLRNGNTDADEPGFGNIKKEIREYITISTPQQTSHAKMYKNPHFSYTAVLPQPAKWQKRKQQLDKSHVGPVSTTSWSDYIFQCGRKTKPNKKKVAFGNLSGFKTENR